MGKVVDSRAIPKISLFMPTQPEYIAMELIAQFGVVFSSIVGSSLKQKFW